MHRLFVAIDIPEPLKIKLEKIGRELACGRIVPYDQLHLTLVFLGSVDDGTLKQVKRGLAGIDSPGFTLSLKGIGHFPPGRKPRVLWVGLSPCRELVSLQEKIAATVSAFGVPLEDRPFSPHITLARFKEAAGNIDEVEKRYRDFASEEFVITSFSLYSSLLSPKGAVHRKEVEYKLRL